MTDEPKNENDRQPFTPASFEKRTAAWMGLAYVLYLLFAVTFALYSGGRELNGTFPLLVVPVAVAVPVVAIHRQRQGTAPGGLPLTIFMVALCAVGLVICLAAGVPALVAAVRG
jgi:FtsH-binding integral membrane protein